MKGGERMKKTHQWDVLPVTTARCPFCGRRVVSIGREGFVGDKIICKKCKRKFELGEIK